MSYIPFKPKPGTLLDLVKKCPVCNRTVVWPTTQMNKGFGRPATDQEMKILEQAGFNLAWARELGTSVATVKYSGQLLHEPCYFRAVVTPMLIKREMTKAVTVLQRWIETRKE